MKRLLTAFSLAALLLGQAAPASAQRGRIEELKSEIQKTQGRIDKALLKLFKDQVEAAVYRSRLSALQKQWQTLFSVLGGKPRLQPIAPPPPNRFAIAEVAASDATSFERALVTPSCKKRKGCRIWARIAFGKALVKKGVAFEVSADITSKSGKKYAVPTKEIKVTRPVMMVELKLDRIYIYKGTHSGVLKVLCDGRYQRSPFEIQLLY